MAYPTTKEEAMAVIRELREFAYSCMEGRGNKEQKLVRAANQYGYGMLREGTYRWPDGLYVEAEDQVVKEDGDFKWHILGPKFGGK